MRPSTGEQVGGEHPAKHPTAKGVPLEFHDATHLKSHEREMSIYHPDKVAHLGSELQELAKRKAQAINQAYEELAKQFA